MLATPLDILSAMPGIRVVVLICQLACIESSCLNVREGKPVLL